MPPALSDSRKTGGLSPRLEPRAPSPRARAPGCRRAGTGGVRRRGRGGVSSSRAIATYWVKTSTAPSSARTVPSSSSSRSSFSERPASRPVGLLQEVRRVVADLLEPGQQRQHQPAAGVLVGALDPVHGVADEGLVEDDLLAGQPERVVGLGLGRQLRRDAGVGLAAAQQERADQLGELARLGRLEPGLDRRGPDLAEGVAAAEQPGGRPVEDRPQLGEVVLHRGAGQRDPGPRSGCARSARAVEERAFLTCCASSATTRSQRDRGQRRRRRGAWCRTS